MEAVLALQRREPREGKRRKEDVEGGRESTICPLKIKPNGHWVISFSPTVDKNLFVNKNGENYWTIQQHWWN
jgi:hypothetical protein